MNPRGKVYLIGVGPGDVELLTLKAVRRLALADVVLIDDLANPEVLQFAPKTAEVIHVGKRGGGASTAQAGCLPSGAKADQSFSQALNSK